MREVRAWIGVTASGPGWADSDAVLGAIFGTFLVVAGLSGVGLFAAARVPQPFEALVGDLRPERAARTQGIDDAPLSISLLGDGPIALAAIAPPGALDAASSLHISLSSASAPFEASISTLDSEWLSAPEQADYRRGSGRPSMSRYQELEAVRMPGTMTDTSANIGAGKPSIRTIGEIWVLPAWLAPLPIPLDPSRSVSASFGPEY